jgi:adenylate kinase family enzyme
MIIELFGPPGAGKTTLARALAVRLRDRGHVAQLKLSYRPTERVLVLDSCEAAARRYRNVMIRRLGRPLGEVLTIARHPFANSRDVKMAIHLVGLLPPENIFASIKNGQYIFRLSHSWYEESGAARVALFDQAFVQAVCSLALLAGVANDTSIANALDYAPQSDLLIRLDAPLELLKARLDDRRRLQGRIEQMLEPGLKKSLASIQMIDRLHNLLLRRGRSVLHASSLDQESLGESMNMIEEEVVRRLQNPAQRGLGMATRRTAALDQRGNLHG